MNTIDLQIQSTASDGKHDPREIVTMAKEKPLQVIALTDHDTVDGVPEALEASSELGMRIIPGIEMSVEEHGAHVLGYGVDHTHREFLENLETLKQGRIAGAKQMVENLKRAGFVVEWEDVVREATGSVFARPHLARAVLNRPENKQKLGGISTVHDFIEAYLGNDSLHYVHRSHISAKDAISLIHLAGGVAVWSHPAIHFRERFDELEEFLRSLMDWGIQGLEVFNPSHTEDDAEYIQNLAFRYRLLRTAGSDFHEKGNHPSDERGLHSATGVGDYETHGFPIDDIIPQLDEAMAQAKQKD